MTGALSFRRNRLLFGFALIGILLITMLSGLSVRASAADCDDNAIIHCGLSSKSNFIDRVRDNNSLNGHHDLKAIYAYYGLEPADYDRFVSSARSGVAYRDGRIVVDGRTVATDAKSIGRLASYQGSGYFSRSIPGAGTFYGNTNQQAFARGTGSIPVTVLFDDKGAMQFAVLNSCGNPIYGSVSHPSYSCNKLHQQAVSTKAGTFNFSTDASAGNGADIVKLVYSFGDGASVTTANPNQIVQHTYARNGNYTARVTVYVSLPGNQTVTVTSTNCATEVTVALPYYQCVQLLATTIDNSKYKYKFTVSTKAGSGASVSSADFTFGDGKSASVKGSNPTTTHTYSKDGSYASKVVLHILLPGGKTATATSTACAKKVPVAIPYYSCVQLGGAVVDQSKYSYSYTATAEFGNGARFVSADFDFGDKAVAKAVKPTGTAVTTTHAYTAAGNYRITATLHFSIGTTAQTVQCSAVVTPTQPPTPECKPNIPQGSALCGTPCQDTGSTPPADTTDTSTDSNSSTCAAVLPNTGAGSFVALFGAAAVAGFFIFRQFTYRKHAMAGATIASEAALTPADEPQVVHPQPHRNATTRHPSYHRPHRFRPRSHQ